MDSQSLLCTQEEELIKLLYLVQGSENQMLHKDYIAEKIGYVLERIPIVLHPPLYRKWARDVGMIKNVLEQSRASRNIV